MAKEVRAGEMPKMPPDPAYAQYKAQGGYTGPGRYSAEWVTPGQGPKVPFPGAKMQPEPAPSFLRQLLPDFDPVNLLPSRLTVFLLSLVPAVLALFLCSGLAGSAPGLARLKIACQGLSVMIYVQLPLLLSLLLEDQLKLALICGIVHFFANSHLFGVPFFPKHLCLRTAVYDFVLKSPLVISHLGIFRKFGLQWAVDSDVTEVSLEAFDEHRQSLKTALERLRSYGSRWQRSEDCRVFEYLLSCLVELQDEGAIQVLVPSPNMTMAYPLCSVGGLQQSTSDFLLSFKLHDSQEDYANYVQRLRKLARVYRSLSDMLQGQAPGTPVHTAPACVLKRSAEAMPHFRVQPVSAHSLLLKIPEKHGDLRTEAEKILEIFVYPAHKELEELLKQLCKVKEAHEKQHRIMPGIKFNLPQSGEKLYRTFLKLHTSTTFTPKTIHERGLAEVERVQKKIAELLAPPNEPDSAFSAARLKTFLSTQLDSRPAEQILEEYRSLRGTVEPHLAKLFHKEDFPAVGFDVVQMTKDQEAINPGALYLPGQASVPRNGTFLVNLADGRRAYRCQMKSLFCHETIPGHHWQMMVAQQQKHLPIYRSQAPWFTGYIEGWGLYAETLGSELKLYDNTDQFVGWLLFELLRAVRLVVDTGLHFLGWNRGQAIEYMVSQAGVQSAEAEAEIDRYLCMPGQACGYKVGQWELLRLRQHFKDSVGPEEYDIRDFHSVVLRAGAMPLALLEKKLQEYLDAQAKAKGRKKQD